MERYIGLAAEWRKSFRGPKTLTEVHEQEDREQEVTEEKKSKPKEKLVQKNK
jgi:hypothetical protein